MDATNTVLAAHCTTNMPLPKPFGQHALRMPPLTDRVARRN